MKKTVHYAFFTVFVFLTACSSSDDTGGNGNNGGNPTSSSYWPHVMGNKWYFENVEDQADTFVHHLHKTINYEGENYFQTEPINAAENVELTDGTREDNGVFYELHGATSQMGVHIAAGTIKSLDTHLKVGEKWTDYVVLTISGAANGVIEHTHEGKILEKATTVTVNGKTYQNILKTELLKTVHNSITGSSYVLKYEDWLAKGIGPIYRKTTYYYGSFEEVEQYELTHYDLH